jgi:5-methylcytosine-specific restriction endonuclease McrA
MPIEKVVKRTTFAQSDRDDREYWFCRTPAERTAALFDDATKRSVYEKQTSDAKAKGKSNCPLCAAGPDANKGKIYELREMDADHVAAWSKGGGSSANNCQMLCITHNRAKGNR